MRRRDAQIGSCSVAGFVGLQRRQRELRFDVTREALWRVSQVHKPTPAYILPFPNISRQDVPLFVDKFSNFR
jgi:hypothetical protein